MSKTKDIRLWLPGRQVDHARVLKKDENFPAQAGLKFSKGKRDAPVPVLLETGGVGFQTASPFAVYEES